MSKVKRQIIRMIENLPEKVSVDDIFGKLYFRMQVDSGLSDLDRGRSLPHWQVKNRLAKWLNK